MSNDPDMLAVVGDPDRLKPGLQQARWSAGFSLLRTSSLRLRYVESRRDILLTADSSRLKPVPQRSSAATDSCALGVKLPATRQAKSHPCVQHAGIRPRAEHYCACPILLLE